MSQQLVVDKSLKLKGAANYSNNILGNFSEKKLVLYDDFVGIALDTGRWVSANDNGGTEAITVATNGTVTLTTGATDNDRSLLASPLNFLCAKNPIIECRLKVSAATTVGINFGFNDATTEGDDVLAMELTAGAATLVNGKTSNGAMFVYDTDGSVDYWYAAGTKADTEGTPIVVPSKAIIENGTAYVSGQPKTLTTGSNTVTVRTTGTVFVTLPAGCAGTATDGTGTFTESVATLVPGVNTLTCTAIGTVTIVVGPAPSTTFEVLRVGLDTVGNATFWRNGLVAGFLPACITAATPLCLFLGVIARTTSARVLTVDYIKAWQDR